MRRSLDRDHRGDLEVLHRIEGLYVGSLDAEEKRIFQVAVKEGRAYRTYQSPGGFLGLAKVALVKQVVS